MPKDTFFNLADEKRKKIINEALKEFEENDFESASINQIVIRSEISKGSFLSSILFKENSLYNGTERNMILFPKIFEKFPALKSKSYFNSALSLSFMTF